MEPDCSRQPTPSYLFHSSHIKTSATQQDKCIDWCLCGYLFLCILIINIFSGISNFFQLIYFTPVYRSNVADQQQLFRQTAMFICTELWLYIATIHYRHAESAIMILAHRFRLIGLASKCMASFAFSSNNAKMHDLANKTRGTIAAYGIKNICKPRPSLFLNTLWIACNDVLEPKILASITDWLSL